MQKRELDYGIYENRRSLSLFIYFLVFNNNFFISLSPVIRYGGEDASQSCMSVRFNTLGNLILALRRRLPPILYSTTSEASICQFYHPDYYNR